MRCSQSISLILRDTSILWPAHLAFLAEGCATAHIFVKVHPEGTIFTGLYNTDNKELTCILSLTYTKGDFVCRVICESP